MAINIRNITDDSAQKAFIDRVIFRWTSRLETSIYSQTCCVLTCRGCSVAMVGAHLSPAKQKRDTLCL